MNGNGSVNTNRRTSASMSKQSSRPVRYLFTRVATAGSAVGAFVAIWATVAASAGGGQTTGAGQSDTASADQAVIEQDGWRWDPKAQEWVAIDPQPAVQPTAVAAPTQQVIVVERQPIYYNTYYVTEVGPGSGGASTTAARPSVSTTSGTQSPAGNQPAAVSAGLPPPGPASLPPAPAPAALPVAPVSAPAPPAPAPAPAPAQAPAPVAPPPPKPAAVAPKTTRAS